uniref:Uncharacterized protein n=1 Tax=Cucumis sativus TaxID=3659 RepID=A0A0A0L5A2_CUCSA
MELMINWLLLIVPCVGFVLGFGVLKRLNNLYYALKLGKKWDELPPGDLSWPLIGSTLSFLKYFTFGPPERFIGEFSRRYISLISCIHPYFYTCIERQIMIFK